MSILLKALKQAEADRENARLARQTGQREVGHGGTDTRISNAEMPAGNLSPMHVQTGAVDPHSVSARALPTTGGLWITLVLAVVCAVGFGYWVRKMSAVRATSAPPGIVQALKPSPASTLLPGPIPAALSMHEAGPLYLRLDYHVKTPGARAP